MVRSKEYARVLSFAYESSEIIDQSRYIQKEDPREQWDWLKLVGKGTLRMKTAALSLHLHWSFISS